MITIWTVFFFGLSAVAVAAPFLQHAGAARRLDSATDEESYGHGWTREELENELALGKLSREEYEWIAEAEGYPVLPAARDAVVGQPEDSEEPGSVPA